MGLKALAAAILRGQQLSAQQTTQMLAGLQDAVRVKSEPGPAKLNRLATNIAVPKLSARIASHSVVTRLNEYYEYYDALERYLIDMGLDMAVITWMQDSGQKLANLYEQRVLERDERFKRVNGSLARDVNDAVSKRYKEGHLLQLEVKLRESMPEGISGLLQGRHEKRRSMSPLQKLADMAMEMARCTRARTEADMQELARLIEEPRMTSDAVADLQYWRRWSTIAMSYHPEVNRMKICSGVRRLVFHFSSLANRPEKLRIDVIIRDHNLDPLTMTQKDVDDTLSFLDTIAPLLPKRSSAPKDKPTEKGKGKSGTPLVTQKGGAKGRQVCRYFARTGDCRYGEKCKMRHTRDQVPARPQVKTAIAEEPAKQDQPVPVVQNVMKGGKDKGGGKGYSKWP